MGKFILSLDQGTTSSRAIIFNKNGDVVHTSQKEFTQYFPKPGWVEHNPNEIWGSILSVIAEVLSESSIKPNKSRELVLQISGKQQLFGTKKQEPVYNAIVWQSRQTSEICEELTEKGYNQLFHEKTGLLIDAYFSGTK